jgi:hypothetical protein
VRSGEELETVTTENCNQKSESLKGSSILAMGEGQVTQMQLELPTLWLATDGGEADPGQWSRTEWRNRAWQGAEP